MPNHIAPVTGGLEHPPGPAQALRPTPRVGLTSVWLSDGGAELTRLLAGSQPQAAFTCAQPQATPEQPLSLVQWRVRRDVALVHEGDSAHAVYVVRSGSFKCIRTQEDGYEQVLSIAHPGDVLGFESLCTGHLSMGVVALEEASAFALPLPGLLDLRQHHPSLDQALHLALSRQLLRASRLAQMTTAVSSEVRLARFLLWLAERMGELGQSTRRLRLRMSRRDIASLMGVAHETVSRCFGAMAEAGIIRVDNRDVELLDAEALRARARAPRAVLKDAPRTTHGVAPVAAAGAVGHADGPAAGQAGRVAAGWGLAKAACAAAGAPSRASPSSS